MNWINKADTVEGSDGKLLLKGFSEPETREGHKFTGKIDKLLDGNDPTEDQGFMIESVRKNMIENMVRKKGCASSLCLHCVKRTWADDDLVFVLSNDDDAPPLRLDYCRRRTPSTCMISGTRVSLHHKCRMN